MPDLPTDGAALAVLVFLLGARHGLDADHLAAIDGLTRLNTLRGQRFARCCGLFFALGHGVAVLGVAMLVALASRHVAAPPWLDALGAWLSITLLTLLGLANLRALLATAPGQAVAAAGLSRFARLQRADRPLTVALVGLLFALSFDTLSLAALFGVTGAPRGGALAALGLASLFVLGMLLVDGLNGYWIARLLARADRGAVLASRLLTAAVAGFSLLLAAFGALRRLAPGLAGWSTALVLFAAAALLLAGGYLLTRIRIATPRVEEA